MSKKRCCGNTPVVPVVSPVASLCANPICALILLIILQRTCLLENKNAFLLILIFIGYCCCKGGCAGNTVKSCGC